MHESLFGVYIKGLHTDLLSKIELQFSGKNHNMPKFYGVIILTKIKENEIREQIKGLKYEYIQYYS